MVHTFCRVLFWKNVDNFGQFWKQKLRIWPDWGNTTRADMAGLRSIGIRSLPVPGVLTLKLGSSGQGMTSAG